MKEKCLWARARRLLIATVAMVSLGSSAANPADAPELPSSKATGGFHLWQKMHPSSYTLDMKAVQEQCSRAEPTETWLTAEHCEVLPRKIKAGECKVKMVKDGIRLDRLLGRVNGDPKGESRPWPLQEKQTGRLDRALLCDLGDGVSAYWFTGDPGKSCNNVGFVYIPPPTKSAKWVCHESLTNVTGPTVDYLYLREVRVDTCCDGDLNIPSLYFYMEDDTRGYGYTEECGWE